MYIQVREWYGDDPETGQSLFNTPFAEEIEFPHILNWSWCNNLLDYLTLSYTPPGEDCLLIEVFFDGLNVFDLVPPRNGSHPLMISEVFLSELDSFTERDWQDLIRQSESSPLYSKEMDYK